MGRRRRPMWKVFCGVCLLISVVFVLHFTQQPPESNHSPKTHPINSQKGGSKILKLRVPKTKQVGSHPHKHQKIKTMLEILESTLEEQGHFNRKPVKDKSINGMWWLGDDNELFDAEGEAGNAPSKPLADKHQLLCGGCAKLNKGNGRLSKNQRCSQRTSTKLSETHQNSFTNFTQWVNLKDQESMSLLTHSKIQRQLKFTRWESAIGLVLESHLPAPQLGGTGWCETVICALSWDSKHLMEVLAFHLDRLLELNISSPVVGRRLALDELASAVVWWDSKWSHGVSRKLLPVQILQYPELLRSPCRNGERRSRGGTRCSLTDGSVWHKLLILEYLMKDEPLDVKKPEVGQLRKEAFLRKLDWMSLGAIERISSQCLSDLLARSLSTDREFWGIWRPLQQRLLGFLQRIDQRAQILLKKAGKWKGPEA
ncbi:Golgi-associated kinase 1A-like [Ambystoma mexicanum]|uniref:Golgi-associated kinase 1A-like n=1 Tax=Ambystoma mexicanum TaxID=8296 RepID=UPI0037E7486E